MTSRRRGQEWNGRRRTDFSVSLEQRGTPRSLSAVEAGSVLGLPADVVRALSDAGYVRSTLHRGVPRFALGDLKAFQARVSDEDAEGWNLDAAHGGLDPDDLVALLEGRVDDMAARTLHLLQRTLPEVKDWTDAQRERFVADAGERIRAMLAVCAHGPGGGADDEAIARDLADIGADAAHHGVPLPGVLVAVRTTRDLMVQAAVEIAEERGRRWGLALAVALTRVLPAIDRLADAVARGYWEAVLEIEAEGLDRFRTIVEHVDSGVFTLDADGVVRYVNPAMEAWLGRSAEDVVGHDAVTALGVAPGVDATVGGRPVRQFERLRDGVVVGWDGVVAARQ